MSEYDEKFQLFSKRVSFQNDCIDTKNAVLTGRPNVSCSITGNDLKKSPQKVQKFFKFIFFKMFLWRGRKQLEGPDDFFFDKQPNFFRSIFKKCQFVSFANKIHLKVSVEPENSVLTTPLLFIARIGQKNRSVSKNEKKNYKQNCSSLKCYFGHVECSSNIPVEKLGKKPKTSCSMSENDEKFQLFSKKVFFKTIL